jgi:hypothetical protein
LIHLEEWKIVESQIVETYAQLHRRRLERWCQTAETRIPDAEAGARLIERVGIATLYPASPEVPNLYHAYTGSPSAPTDAKWDSPSGEVYAWRWALGRREAAFYSVLVRGRPTWISWDLLPAALRLCGETRMPDELRLLGVLSEGAYRMAQALEAAGGVLSTGELREAAGFPKGKGDRSAYLKAVDELDTRLMVAKVFATDDEKDLDMRHALVHLRYRAHVVEADRMTREQALEQLLLAYLPHAAYAAPVALARHLKLPEDELCAGLERLVEAGRAIRATFPEVKGGCYVWRDAS